MKKQDDPVKESLERILFVAASLAYRMKYILKSGRVSLKGKYIKNCLKELFEAADLLRPLLSSDKEES